MIGKATIYVVVLSVDVVGDGASHGHLKSPWDHRREIAPREKAIYDLLDGDPRFNPEPATLGVKAQKTVEPLHQESTTLREKRGISIAAPQAIA